MSATYWQDKDRLITEYVRQYGVGAFRGCSTIIATMYFQGDQTYTEKERKEIDPGRLELLGGDPNLIHHAYHLTMWERETGKSISAQKTVLEIGGGYGAMAHVCHLFGFGGKYTIVDLPGICGVQEYYLSSVGIDVNHTIEPVRAELFISTWALSEYVDEWQISEILLNLKADAGIIALQEKWFDRDNLSLFSRFARQRGYSLLPLETICPNWYVFW
jgi:hypothetical protein